MSNTVRRSPVRDVLEELNLARIAAIATTISIHIVAFGFLMVPIALPDMVRSLPSVTEVTFVMPPQPQPVVPPAPIQPARPETTPRIQAPVSTPIAQSVPNTQTVPNGEALVDNASAVDYQVIGEVGSESDTFGNGTGGDVDASTRAQFPIKYPIEAIRAQAAGVVWVFVRYDARGNVTETRIHRSSRNRDLDKAALAGVRKWKINPRLVQGQPVGGESLVEVAFNL